MYFRLQPQSGAPAYLQLVQQVRRAVLQGTLAPGDRLPAAREVVAALAINPNTVLKAYSQLEHEGIAFSRPGLGTFIAQTAPAAIPKSIRARLEPRLRRWLDDARHAGLNDESIGSLFAAVVETSQVDVA